MFDVIIVGGGPAGLQSALTLGRVHRSTLLLDSGTYRNASATHMHNFIGQDGTPPAEFRAQARAELKAYADVEVRDSTVTAIEQIDDGFRVTTDDGNVEARRIILATGLRDDVGTLPGAAELWGSVVIACPYCHGHELSGRTVAVQGGSAHRARIALLLNAFAGKVIVLADGEPVDPTDGAILSRAGIPVVPSRVTGLQASLDGAVVTFEADDELEVAGFFAISTFAQASPLADQLGLAKLASGCIEVDDFQRTSVPGIFAAGDLAHRASMPMPMAAVLNAAAAGQLAGAMASMDAVALEHGLPVG